MQVPGATGACAAVAAPDCGVLPAVDDPRVTDAFDRAPARLDAHCRPLAVPVLATADSPG